MSQSANFLDLATESFHYQELEIIGRAKRAPHWGVQSRFRVIYICRYVCPQSLFLAVKPVTTVLFISYMLEL